MGTRSCVLAVGLLACLTVGSAQESDALRIAGTVRDAADNAAANVMVFVTDHATGVPVFSDGVLLAEAVRAQRTDLLVAKTETDGSFEITVPEGEYRLVAQRWRPPTQPWTSDMGAFDGLPHFGATVELFGVAERVVVPSRNATSIELQPQGSASVVVTLDPESGNNETLLVISTEAPPLDPVFGFEMWRSPFIDHAFGMNRMPYGQTTFLNVPAGEVHLSAFANDNWPGFGASSAMVPEVGAVEVQIDLVAGWSDGHKKPGSRLLPLYDKAVEQDWDLRSLPPIQQVYARIGDGDSLMAAVESVEKDSREVTLPDGTTAPLRDVWAVALYLEQWPRRPE